MKNFRITICSPPDREDLVSEVYYKNCQWAEINQEIGNFMRIYNVDTDSKVNQVIIYLTLEEAQELKDSLDNLLCTSKKNMHEHIPDREDDFKREITVCIYDKNNLEDFHPRAIKLIKEDK